MTDVSRYSPVAFGFGGRKKFSFEILLSTSTQFQMLLPPHLSPNHVYKDISTTKGELRDSCEWYSTRLFKICLKIREAIFLRRRRVQPAILCCNNKRRMSVSSR